MEIRIGINDCKKIANNVEKKYSEIEQCLARKMLAQEHVLAELKHENAELFDLVYGIYNRVNGSKYAERLKERRKNELRAASVALSAKAVLMCSEAENEQ